MTWNLATADNITYTLTAIAVSGEGTVIPSIDAGSVLDLLANPNLASTAVDNSVLYNAPPGAFSITGVTGGSDSTADNQLTSGYVPTINWSTSNLADSYDVTVYRNNGTTVQCPLQNVTAPTLSYDFSGCTLNPGTNYKAQVIAKRASGSQLAASNSQFTFSTQSLFSISSHSKDGAQPSTATTLPIRFRIVFNRAIAPGSFTNSDILNTGTATGITWNITTSDNITYTIEATAITTSGTIRTQLASGSVTDTNGNSLSATSTSSDIVTYAPPPQSFTISGVTGNADVTVDSSLTSGARPEIHWTTSINANSYRITVFENDETTVRCPQVTVNSPTTNYNFTNCILQFNTTYKIRATAVGSSNLSASNDMYAFTVSPGIHSVSVNTVYPTNGANWNDYIKNSLPNDPIYSQSDVACDGSETGSIEACIHGAEIKSSNYTQQATCSNVTAQDSLDLLNWVCDDTSGNAVLYSTGLKPNKGLRDVIATTSSFKSIFISIAVNGIDIAQSTPTIWWSNTIQLAPNAFSAHQTLSASGTIYTIDGTISTSRGYNINGDKIAIVTLGSTTLSTLISSWPLNADSSSGEVGSNLRTLIAAGAQKFIWIETATSSSISSNSGKNIYLYDVKFSQLRNITDSSGYSFASNTSMISITNSTYLKLKDIVSSFSTTNAGNTALEFTASSGMSLENINLSSVPTTGISFVGPSSQNQLKQITLGYAPFGSNVLISLNNFHNSALSDLILPSGANSSLVLTSSSGNTFERVEALSGSGTYSILLNTSTQNRFNQVECNLGFGASGCISLASNSNNNSFHALNLNATGSNAMLINGSHDNKITQSIIQGTASNLINIVNSNRTTLNGVTSYSTSFGANNGVILDNSNQTTINNLITAAVSRGLYLTNGSSSSIAQQVHASVSMMGTSINLNASSFNFFSKFISTVSGFTTKCTVTGGTDPGLTNSTCLPSHASNHTYLGAIDTNSAFNTDLELLASDNTLRNRTENGNSANTAFINGSSCPPGLDPTNWVTTDQQTTANTFLINAIEIVSDTIGDNDGLCEIDEACIHSPNFGAYQGHGDYASLSCNMPAGPWQNTTIYAYPANGR